MSIIDKIFKRAIPNRSPLYMTGLTPPDWNQEAFLRGYSSIGWLHAVVFRIALGCSEVEWTLFDVSNQDKPKQIYKHPILTLLHQVNPFQTSNEFIALDTIYNELIGESFWALNFNGNGEPAEIILPYPHKMSVVPAASFPFVKGYVYGTGANAIPFDVNEIIHFKYPNPLNQYRGLAPARAIGINLDAEQNADKWVNQFFYNSARPDGVIQFDYNLSDEQFEKLKKQWSEKYKGVSKAHQVALLEGGGKYIQIQNTIKDMDFPNLKQKNRDVILGVFGMPLSVMGISENVNKANCYDSQTEYLTDNGWKLYEQITDDDKIASYDNGYIKFEKPLNRYQYDYNGGMYHYTAKVTDLMVTPNHNLYYRTTEGEYRKTEAKDANYTKLVFKASCNWQGTVYLDIPFEQVDTKAWLEFLGYFISEGGLSVKARNGHHYMFTLAQKDKNKADKIRFCLDRLPFKYTENFDGYYRWTVYGKEIHQYLLNTIGAYCEDKHIPQEIKALDASLLLILFDALMLGDGSWDKRGNRTSGYYATTSKQLADDVMEIALKVGYRVSCKSHQDKRPNKQLMYYVHFSECQEVEVQKSNGGITIEQYNGKVSCFEVPSHLLITRRNGFVSIQGNSEAGDYTFARWIVKPRLDWKKAKIQEQLIPKFRRAENLEIGFKEVVPETTEQKITSAESGMRAGYLTINEARRMQGYDPLPNGDVLLVPLNLIPTPIKEIAKPPAPAPAPASEQSEEEIPEEIEQESYKGGEGSGNFGHEGRPGEVGGSGEGGGGKPSSEKPKPSGGKPSGDKPKPSSGATGEEWASSLDDDEKMTLRRWQDGGACYQLRNYQATGKGSESIKEYEKTFNSAMDKDGSFEGTVYRGMALESQGDYDRLVNSKTITMKSHSSSSKDLAQAQRFTGKEKTSVIMNIRTKSGVDITAASYTSQLKKQKEVILKKGTKYEVVGRGKIGNITRLDLVEK